MHRKAAKVRITITIEKALRTRLREVAAEDRRTESAVIEIALERLFLARAIGRKTKPLALKTASR